MPVGDEIHVYQAVQRAFSSFVANKLGGREGTLKKVVREVLVKVLHWDQGHWD